MQPNSSIRTAAHFLLSPRVRRSLRVALRELPYRLRDAVPDALDQFRTGMPLPPARLRRLVGINGSRSHFLTIGRAAADDIAGIARRAGLDLRDFHRWLDFGCGCGRVARHLIARGIEVWGTDVDPLEIAWCRRHFDPHRFSVNAAQPPTSLSDASFDVIYSVSVFTHLDETSQFAWLAELRRLLRPGGALIVSTHPPELVYNRPDMTRAQHEQLRDRGFAFAASEGPFNDHSAFHALPYLEREWTRFFRLARHEPSGLAGYQDLSLWRV